MTGNINPLPAFELLRTIPRDLFSVDEIPLFHISTQFPWEKLTLLLKDIFEIQNLELNSNNIQWRHQNDLFQGMNDNLMTLKFNIPKLEGDIFWAMSDQDVSLLMSLLLIKKSDPVFILEKHYKEGFYKFLAVEILNALSKDGFNKNLIPQLQKDQSIPSGIMLTIDISITIDEKKVWGRLFISPEMRAAIKKLESTTPLNYLNSPIASKLDLIVHLEIGKTTLSFSTWNSIHKGDFLILDNCLYIPDDEEQSNVMLTIEGVPLYRGKFKNNNIKILEHPMYYEVEKTMDREDENEIESQEGFEEEESELEDLDDADFDESFEEDLEEETLEDEKPQEKHEEHTPETDKPPQETIVKEAKLADDQKELPKSPTDLPVTIVVEVGRLQMKVQQLLELQPGNLLELDVHPERGVDLVVNGKRVAKGELLRIGDVLGVRIVDI